MCQGNLVYVTSYGNVQMQMLMRALQIETTTERRNSGISVTQIAHDVLDLVVSYSCVDSIFLV